MVRLQGPLLSLPYVHAPSTQLESYFTRSTTSLLGGENLTIVAYTFTDTKLDVEFFYKVQPLLSSLTSLPTLSYMSSSLPRVQPLPLVLLQGYNNSHYVLWPNIKTLCFMAQTHKPSNLYSDDTMMIHDIKA